MPLHWVNNRLKAVTTAAPGYISALSSGYLLVGANMLVQFALTPFYLKHLGVQQFGFLMMFLNLINFVSIGITWMSGGLVRILGERWAINDQNGFRHVFVVGKYIFTFYAMMAAAIALLGWWLGYQLGFVSEPLSATLLLAGLYLILMYEGLPERQAFIGINRQVINNLLELVRLLFFALLTWLLLPQLKDLSVVWIALMAGIIFQRVAGGIYWSKHVNKTGWEAYQPEMKPIFKRLASKQGVGYACYGALLLILQADTMIVGFLGGAEAAGQFVLLWKIPEAIGLLLWRVPSAIQPRLIELDAGGKKEAVNALFRKGRLWFVLLILVAVIIYMMLGPWITELWVGEHAPKQQWMYLIAGVALFFNAFARWPISFAYALVKLKPLTKVIFFEVIGKVLATIILFPYLGIAAPIVATVLTHGAYAMWGYQNLMKET